MAGVFQGAEASVVGSHHLRSSVGVVVVVEEEWQWDCVPEPVQVWVQEEASAA